MIFQLPKIAAQCGEADWDRVSGCPAGAVEWWFEI
jgi:hypothetical protein